MTFYRGQKVTPIDDRPWVTFPTWEAGKHSPPKFGDVYEVAGVSTYMTEKYGEVAVLALVEFAGRVFTARSFRPVVERKLPACLTDLQDIKNHTPIPSESIVPREAFV